MNFTGITTIFKAFSSVQSAVTAVSGSNGILPSPVSFMVNSFYLVHVGAMIARRWITGYDMNYLCGSAVNLAFGDNRILCASAQVVLIFRNTLELIRSKQETTKAYNALLSAINGEFPRADRRTWASQFEGRVRDIASATYRLFHQIILCSWAHLQLGFAIFIDPVTQYEANSGLFSNIAESYETLKQDPGMLGRVIDNHAGAIDALFNCLNVPYSAKDLSKTLTSQVLNMVHAQHVAAKVFEQAKESVQKSAYILCNLMTGSTVAPLGASATYARKRPAKQLPRFYSTV